MTSHEALLSEDMRDLLTIFSRLGVQYLIVGAHAVSAYVEPRATKDLDILLNTTAENAVRVLAALKEFGAPLAGVTQADFEDPDSFFVVGVKPNRVDLLKSIPGLDFKEAWAKRKVVVLGTLELVIPCLEHLLAAKLAAGRPQDLLDAEKLKKVLSV